MRDLSEFAKENDSVGHQVNKVIDRLQEDVNFLDFMTWLKIQWRRLYGMIRVFHNDGKKVKQKDFTGHYAKLHEYLQEDTAMKELANVLKVPSSEMHNTCVRILAFFMVITPSRQSRMHAPS